ncbi:hypothetical protein pp2_241 [Vibrio phage phi-pp2]|uniref:Uncharacterized protein n=1 Tax=Vibrio phage phi-pp2 TaxID=1204514 RepID=I6XH57_9CAUD|nr:hypothetical protein pp2_241 [Vibrio phage phi-pp2]
MTKGWSDYELEGRSKQEPVRHKMQDSVDEMCRIMRDEHDRFSVSTHTVDFDNGIELWRSDMTCIWTGRTTQKVFTWDQAKQLRDAYDDGMQTKKTKAQEEIERKFLRKKQRPQEPVAEKNSDRGIGVEMVGIKKSDKRWWEFWK